MTTDYTTEFFSPGAVARASGPIIVAHSKAGEFLNPSGGSPTPPSSTPYFLMIGKGGDNSLHTWVVDTIPDFTAAHYSGPGTPLVGVKISSSWSE